MSSLVYVCSLTTCVKFASYVQALCIYMHVHCITAQALRNLVNKSRQKIEQFYSELERKLKSSAKKEEALEQMRRGNQDEIDKECVDFEIPLDPISEKIRIAEFLKTKHTKK